MDGPCQCHALKGLLKTQRSSRGVLAIQQEASATFEPSLITSYSTSDYDDLCSKLRRSYRKLISFGGGRPVQYPVDYHIDPISNSLTLFGPRYDSLASRRRDDSHLTGEVCTFSHFNPCRKSTGQMSISPKQGFLHIAYDEDLLRT